jgi:FKBP-type peptidyl-prolyl cis-trans isomerase SlyD
MKCGDSKEIAIAAADAFGEIDPDDLIELPRTEFPRNLSIKAGDILHYQVEPGDEFEVGVMTADEKTVRLNLGHPLAGKDLIYWVKVIDVREANEKDCAAGSAYPEPMYQVRSAVKRPFAAESTVKKCDIQKAFNG